MSSWLRNKREDDNDEPVLRRDVDAVLPASVRPPELHRFAEDEDETDDADLDFLTALASEVDRTTAAPAAAPAQTSLRGGNPRIDDMQVFREMKDDGNKIVRFNHQVGDVEMGDLLEELNTVSAALRRQRAA